MPKSLPERSTGRDFHGCEAMGADQVKLLLKNNKHSKHTHTQIEHILVVRSVSFWVLSLMVKQDTNHKKDLYQFQAILLHLKASDRSSMLRENHG